LTGDLGLSSSTSVDTFSSSVAVSFLSMMNSSPSFFEPDADAELLSESSEACFRSLSEESSYVTEV